ncbi:NAD(P)/FAD-dependent oxidoreductase [Eleftheria terrae]|uniref:NAD(P)/FAD-dependent oxidoreductase n=1 Tax=Eleftheria terrae TaxID=1597781 RepID=UPI00263B7BFD|nr:FAD-dependent oxidoreductase [Eleftheria terrae]WKB50943.1 NAD(P)-binding protein [Eleftheria terrae]
MTAWRIAVVGAGMAGLACARALQEAGHAVQLFDKATAPGGRCTSLATPAGPVDIGTARLRAAGKLFGTQLQAWAADGWLAEDPWAPGHWRPRSTMQAFMRQLADGLPLLSGVEVAGATHDAGRWTLQVHGEVPRTLELGFDALLLALPAGQAGPLLDADPALQAMLAEQPGEPAWTVAAAWPAPLPLPAEGLQPGRLAGRQDVLAAAWHAAGHPGDGIDSRWVLQASSAWSAERLAARPADVTRALLEAFAGVLGQRLARPAYAAAHLWPQAQPASARRERCGWNAALRLGACGDAWYSLKGSQGAERAWLSGRALAQKLPAT